MGDDLFDPPPDSFDGPVEVLVGLGQGETREFGDRGGRTRPGMPFVRDVGHGEGTRIVGRGLTRTLEEA